MISQDSVRNASRIVCIKSLKYNFVANIKTYTDNPDMRNIIECIFEETYTDPCLREILKHVMHNKACNRVWAIVLEQHGFPLFVIRNAAFTDRKLAFRRVLLVKCDDVKVINTSPILGYFLLLNLIAFLSILITNFCVTVSFLR